MDISQYCATSEQLAELFQQAAETAKHLPKEKSKPKSKPKSKSKGVELPKPLPGEGFIKGPIPFGWMRIATDCGTKGAAVGLLIWYAAGWQRKNPIRFSRSVYDQLGIHPKTCRRVLLRMQEASIVSLDLHRGRSPVVTILPTPSDPHLTVVG